ncbi:ArsR/SmtB family transcription factor [Halosegnis rubeus]|uniref:ArsR/SmtB family transcription factor n=1 Tax=Halosegnis rubeus TaxID=2212850 RepID=UPI001CEDB960|nr:winged helix-turn-helix domain-containing protein [Halosegnis rubeus]
MRILQTLDNRPRNPNQLADHLDLNYDTIRHHLDVLADNDVIEASGDDYGAVYLPSETARDNWDTVGTIITQLDS